MSQSLNESVVSRRFQDIVATSLRIDPVLVTMEASLTDLGAESLDLVEISMEAESAFNVWLPEKSLLHTAKELFGSEAIVQDGRLTTLAKRILAGRMSPEEAGLLAGDVTVEDVEKYFLRVGSWVSLITRLLRDCPDSCDACGGALRTAGGFRLKCVDCTKNFQIRSGEELNLEWLRQYHEAGPVALVSQTDSAKAHAQTA